MKRILFSCLFSLLVLPTWAQVPDPSEGTTASGPAIVTSDSSVGQRLSSWRFSIQAGKAFLPGKIQDGLDERMIQYYKRLKWGWSAGADITYFLSEALGVGVKFNNVHVASEVPVDLYDNGWYAGARTLQENIDLSFAGPILSYQWVGQDRKHAFYLYSGMGYLRYRNAGFFLVPITETGATVGYLTELAYDLRLPRRWSAGLSLNLISGILRGYTLSTDGQKQDVQLEQNDYIGLTQITLSVGLRRLF